MKVLDIIIAALMIIGALNWGLIGFFGFNLVDMILGAESAFSRVIYALIGLSALYEVGSLAFDFKSVQNRWCETPSTVKH